MNFENALPFLRSGHRMRRRNWNGAGQFVYLVGPGRYAPTTAAGELIASETVDHKVPYRAYLALWSTSAAVVPWQPTQSDMLEGDWELAGD
jgi:hypothetical protein